MKTAIGLDIGGTKIAAGVCTEEGKLLKKVEIPSDTSSREAMFQSVKEAIYLVLEKNQILMSDVLGIGVGVPGKVDRVQGIAIYQNNLPWAHFPVAERLQNAFQIENVVIDNDVYMAAYAEWIQAGAKIEGIFSYVTVSTGISSSSIMNGDFIQGDGFAGEMGLIPVYSALLSEHEVPVGRLEFTSSGSHLQKYGRKLLDCPELTTKDLFMAYKEGNPKAAEILTAAATSIALGLYSLVCILDPYRIHFGGSVMIHNPFFLELIIQELEKLVIPEQQQILENIYLSKLEQDNGVLGAGLKVFEKNK